VNSPPTDPFEPTAEQVLAGASCLLLDFDGPVCRLFARSRPDRIAQVMRAYLAGEGAPLTDPRFTSSDDPHWILRAPMDPALTQALESLLAGEEEAAALSAAETPGADEFLRQMTEQDRLLAITTNNAPRAVETYLKNHGLDGYFDGRIFGRSTEDPWLMKPHPDCLLRALGALRVSRGDCLMIGDSPADAVAAASAGVPFLGYARTGERVARLRQHHSYPVTVGMGGLLKAARANKPPNG
jgi:HAD superfamily hydrolase (TIGR01509 family)